MRASRGYLNLWGEGRRFYLPQSLPNFGYVVALYHFCSNTNHRPHRRAYEDVSPPEVEKGVLGEPAD